MESEIKKGERRKFMGGMVAVCVGAAASLGIAKKASATENKIPRGQETLYKKTRHVKDYLQTLED
jgi:hypothetical protein